MPLASSVSGTAACGVVRASAALLVATIALGCQTGARFDERRLPRATPTTAQDAGTTDANVDFGNSGLDARVAQLDPDASFVDPVCAAVEATPERIVPTVTLVVDGSGSMRCAYPEPSDCSCDAQLRDQCTATSTTSRWQALRDALFGTPGGFEGVVSKLEGVVRFGLLVYHDPPNAAACPTLPVDVAAALAQRDALAAAFPAEPPGASTPTALALDHVLDALPAATPEAPQHILLATDGKPYECVDSVTLEPPVLDYDGVTSAATRAASAGTVISVLSLAPADGDYAMHLDEVASLGGTGTARVPSDADALANALETVITSAIACELALDGTVEDGLECEGTVKLSGDTLDCDGSDGYRVLDGTRIELRGAACESFRRDPSANLSVSFPCGVFQPS